MRYDFSDEQQAFRGSVRQLFERRATPARLRELWDTDTGRDPQLWAELCGTGASALLVPTELDGVGGTEVDLCGVLEEAGRACVPDALVEALLVGPALIAEGGSREQKEQWLPRIASGDLRVTVALADAPVVADAHVSDLVLLERDATVHAYARDELDLARVHSMDPSRRLFRATPRAGAGTALPDGGTALAAARTRQYAGSSAVLIGLSEELLHRSVEYSRTRHQFDRPIGSFQAVKHQLAHATSMVNLASRAVRAALAFVATGDVRGEESAVLARICALEAEFEANRVALQTHGGVGFTWEHDLQMWLKRGKALEQAHGGHRELSRRAGAVAVDGKVNA